MILGVSIAAECGWIKREIKEYFWNTTDEKQNQIEISRYESYINFNKVGGDVLCEEHNRYERIRRITVYVVEFDARREII
jgi:hypothetical protein